MTLRKKAPNDPQIDGLEDAKVESVEDAWDAEILRRMKDLDSGLVKPDSLKEFRRRLSRAIQIP